MRADWIVHKHECSGDSGGGFQNKSAISGMVESQATYSGVEEGMLLVVHGLKAKPKYNGKVGIVNGTKNAEGRLTVKLFMHAPLLVIKPSNIYHVGAKVQKKDCGKPKSVKCSMHKQELCDTCCFDFCVANHLLKLGRQNQSVAE